MHRAAVQFVGVGMTWLLGLAAAAAGQELLFPGAEPTEVTEELAVPDFLQSERINNPEEVFSDYEPEEVMPLADDLGDAGIEWQPDGSFALEEYPPVAGFGAFHHSMGQPDRWDWFRREARLHHSSTDGRTYDGKPAIQGTSWLNRPYYAGLSSGGFFMTQGVQSHVRNDNDLLASLNLGWDWDFFWGLEFRVARSSPEMVNSTQTSVPRRNKLLITDLSVMYYPAGDTVVRPYLRAGVGWTDFDFVDDSGRRVEASPFTIPLGIGVKWPVRRWMAARLEFVDHLAMADSAVNFHQNLTLVVGLEYRVGAKPKSYWPWYPSRHLR